MIGVPHVEHSKGGTPGTDDAAGDEDEVENKDELHDSACARVCACCFNILLAYKISCSLSFNFRRGWVVVCHYFVT